MDNVVSFSQVVLKRDLEVFSKALFEANMRLQIENQQLMEKLAHLEELLKGSNVPTIGAKFEV